MATVSELIEETRRLLLTGAREDRNKLSAAINSSVTSLAVTYDAASISRGTKLSINLEDIYVWDKSSLTISPVDRGQFGSTAAAHLINDTIHVNPKFSNWEIFDAINKELKSLSSPANGLFQVTTTELAYSAAISGYNFASVDVLDIYEVRYAVPGTSREYPLSQDWELSRKMSDEFTNSTALFVRDAFPSLTVLVKGKFGFTPLVAAMTTNTSPTGIPDTALDILSIGAAWRLTAPREVRRNFNEVQGDTRRADEVPAGANLGASRELGRLRQQRINEEVARLNQTYPSRAHRYPYIAS